MGRLRNIACLAFHTCRESFVSLRGGSPLISRADCEYGLVSLTDAESQYADAR
jgi:hypothetical protein